MYLPFKNLSRWIAYSRKHFEKNLSYKLLLQILEKLDDIWKPTSSSRDEVCIFLEPILELPSTTKTTIFSTQSLIHLESRLQ
jgi:hypothetical protein